MEKPTEVEYINLAKLLAENTGTSEEDAMLFLKDSDILIKRGYVSDVPGWCVDLFIMIGDDYLIAMFYAGRENGDPGRRNFEEWQVFFAGEIY